MNKTIRNISIICVAILSILGIIFLMGLGKEEKPAAETKESVSSEIVIAEKPLESIDPVDSAESTGSPEINNSLGLEAKPTELELEVRQEMLDSFNENLIDIGFVVYDEEMDGFVLNLTNKDVIIEVAEALDGDKAYWNSQLRDPYIEISEYIQEQLGGIHPFMLKNPANDSYLLIAINGVVAFDEINGVDVSEE